MTSELLFRDGDRQMRHRSRKYQIDLLVFGTRETIIDWLCWNDPNGTYTDRDSIAEGMKRMTLEEACRIMLDQISR